jgi:hypothetical protein
MLTRILKIYLLIGIVILSSCKSTTVIDEYRENTSTTIMTEGESIVILGRRNSSSYETESDFVECVGRLLKNSMGGIKVIPEQSFIDSMYPYFETSKAPMDVQNLDTLIQIPEVSNKLNDFKVRYFVWIDGFTETTDSSGAISCTAAPTGAGCFGFATWDDQANYEAVIWDFQDLNLSGKISAESSGTSYLPAVIVPIPLLAQVQSSACTSMASQIKSFIQ